MGVDVWSSQILLPDVSLFKASWTCSQFDNQRIMQSFNSINLSRSSTGRLWHFVGGRVTDGPSVRTFFCSPSQSLMGNIFDYVDSWVSGRPAAARMCIGRKSVSVCLSCQTGNSSLTIPQASTLLSWETVTETGQQQKRVFVKKAMGISVNINKMLNSDKRWWWT